MKKMLRSCLGPAWVLLGSCLGPAWVLLGDGEAWPHRLFRSISELPIFNNLQAAYSARLLLRRFRLPRGLKIAFGLANENPFGAMSLRPFRALSGPLSGPFGARLSWPEKRRMSSRAISKVVRAATRTDGEDRSACCRVCSNMSLSMGNSLALGIGMRFWKDIACRNQF
jgi:hypothetical protein